MLKRKYLVFLLMLFILFSSKAYASCTESELKEFNDLESKIKFIISPRANRFANNVAIPPIIGSCLTSQITMKATIDINIDIPFESFFIFWQSILPTGIEIIAEEILNTNM